MTGNKLSPTVLTSGSVMQCMEMVDSHTHEARAGTDAGGSSGHTALRCSNGDRVCSAVAVLP